MMPHTSRLPHFPEPLACLASLSATGRPQHPSASLHPSPPSFPARSPSLVLLLLLAPQLRDCHGRGASASRPVCDDDDTTTESERASEVWSE